MSDQKTVLFPAFRYILPSDYENWLEQMAAEGWQIDHIGQWSSIVASFRLCEPKKYRLRLRSAGLTTQGVHPDLRGIWMGISWADGERAYLAHGV